MATEQGVGKVHPAGEVSLREGRLAIDTAGGRVHVEWDPEAAVTPLGQLVFFTQFLAVSGLFANWVSSCPRLHRSPNAPTPTDLLGTILLGVLCGQHRYAHLSGPRGDRVNPPGLGMRKVCSEDSVRRAFQHGDPAALAAWQQEQLQRAWSPGLDQPWVLDIDTTIKPLYGRQEGAEVGYNPHKPGRPSHALHSYFVATLRLVLDVEVQAGRQHAAGCGRPGLWRLWNRLPARQRPALIRGDCAYGQQGLLAECEQHGQDYLFRLRQTVRVAELVRALERQSCWSEAGSGWSAAEGTLTLSGWDRSRRVAVLRRLKARPPAGPTLGPAEPLLLEVLPEDPLYDYTVLVTNTTLPKEALGTLYRQRADAENTFDELKNQWGWGGFMTRDLLRSQVAVRNVALIYNWWNLFVRCAEPARPREALTSRPLMLWSVGRLTHHAGQQVLHLTSSHAQANHAQALLSQLSLFLSGLLNAAEQLTPEQRWHRIWHRILSSFRPHGPPALHVTF